MRGQLIAAMAWAVLLNADALGVQLIDMQPNPHWREGLRIQSDRILAKRIDRAQRAGELGCRDFCAELANVFRRVTQVASAQIPDAPAIEWALIVTRSPDDDAYALPDGHIVISEAFIAREHLNVNELAFVLAHEASHVILAHEADTLDTVQALMPHGVNQSVRDLYAAMDFDMGLLLKISPLMVGMEEEADRTGLMLSALAGFDPDSATGYVERMAGATYQTIAATHPDGVHRLAQLREALPLARRVYQRLGEPASGAE